MSCTLPTQTWGWKGVHLFVNDRHNRVAEFLQKIRDGLVGQEPSHRSQQQVDEDQHHSEEILQAGFADFHQGIVSLDVILCGEREQRSEDGLIWSVKL